MDCDYNEEKVPVTEAYFKIYRTNFSGISKDIDYSHKFEEGGNFVEDVQQFVTKFKEALIAHKDDFDEVAGSIGGGLDEWCYNTDDVNYISEEMESLLTSLLIKIFSLIMPMIISF